MEMRYVVIYVIIVARIVYAMYWRKTEILKQEELIEECLEVAERGLLLKS